MRNHRQRRRRQERRTHSPQNPIHKHEMPVLPTLRQQRQARDIDHASTQDQPARSIAIEERPDLHPEKEVEEDVDARDPAYVARVVRLELVRFPVCLEEADGGDQAEGAHDDEEGAEDDEPGSGAAFREGVVMARAGGGGGGCYYFGVWREANS